VRERAAELASAAGITIEHITKNHIRKEDVVARVLVVRGDRPGLLHKGRRVLEPRWRSMSRGR
jgi:hypothetical protein